MKMTISEMQEIAKKKGGQCLSERYINGHTNLTWQCKKGHQWDATPANVKRGSWCPACAGSKRGTIKKMREIAEEHGGQCLSLEYINSITKLTWRCKKGHQWDATPHSLHEGHWCPVCAGVQKGTIEQMQKIARERGGQCLSEKYVGALSKLKWQCKNGHQWEAPSHSLQQGHWCRLCADKR